MLLFIGIIDILQSYRLKKKLEHTWKAMIHDGVSFCVTCFYTVLITAEQKTETERTKLHIYLHHMLKQGCAVVCVQVHNILVNKLQDISVIFS